jgi:hypothetical protein
MRKGAWRIGVASQDIGFTAFTEEDRAAGAEGEGTQFPGGSLWYRILSPLHTLGIEHEQGILTRDPRTKMLGIKRFSDGLDDYDFDVIILQRIVFPELAECMYEARAQGQVFINDMDDWFDGLPPGSVGFKMLGDRPEMQGHYRAALAAGNGIICSTPFLTDWYSKYAATALWRNAIDFASFPLQHVQAEHPTVGWFGSLRFRARDIEALTGVIGPFGGRNKVTFVHVGNEDDYDGEDAFAKRTRMNPTLVEKRPPTSFVLSSMLLHESFDVGLVPLEVINFNQAKTALKGMEYTASGIPFIASPTDEYLRLAELGCGRIARKPKDWTRHLTELLDRDVREAEVEANRKVLAEHYDINDRATEWLSIIETFIKEAQ